MARLTAAQRKKLPASAFADPKDRAYPMEDKNHAEAAVRLVAKYGSPAQKASVHAKAAREYGLGKIKA